MKAGEREYYDLILAAWLHDIGKFYQRAGYKLDKPKDEESMTELARKQGSGPQAYYTHLHAIFSDKFIREYLPSLSVSGTLAALHHSPERAGTDRMRYLAKLITLADWMASGERRERDSEEDAEGYQKEPLISIFSLLQLKDKHEEEKRKISPGYVPLVALDSTLEYLFPVEAKKEAFLAGEGQQSYEELWKQFLAEIVRIRDLSIQDLIFQIPFFLEKFTLTIPATTREKADLSLFHHAKSTAAIASCLYQLEKGEDVINSIFNEIKTLPAEPYKDKEKAVELLKELSLIKREDFLLISGDISGIQDFIYSVTSAKALKGLRGRSFYLQLISEIVARKILDEFKLTEANLLYCGGGHFYILLARKKNAEEKLKAIIEKLDFILLQVHRGKLALILEWAPISYADFFMNFVSVWTEVTCNVGKMKRRKFASLLASMDQEKYWPKIMGPYDVGGERPACEICGEELETAIEMERDAERVCSLCHSFVSLSEDLNRALAMGLFQREPKPIPEQSVGLTWRDVFLALGFDYRFWRHRKDEETRGEAEKESEHLRKYLILNSTDFAGKFGGYKFIANKITGPDEKTTLSLEDIADAAEGIKRWAVLRADVDNLGEIFAEGLGQDKTISRLSMLSAMLYLYFSARMNHLSVIMGGGNQNGSSIKNGNKDPLDYLYLAYAGGDDLFLIGPWSFLPSLAMKISEDFNRFTCGQLTLSAGLYLAPSSKFPIYQAAREAGEAEAAAKKAGRNRISFFERSLTWEKLKEVKDIAEKISNLIKGQVSENGEMISTSDKLLQTHNRKNASEVPRALLTILYDGHKEREIRLKGAIPMERVWRLFYAFKKLMNRIRDERVLKELEWLLNKSITLTPDQDRYEIYPELNIAVRWAEYLTRKEKIKND